MQIWSISLGIIKFSQWYTHTHTHTHIYIYIYIYVCVCARTYVLVFANSSVWQQVNFLVKLNKFEFKNLHQLCVDTGGSQEDLPGTIDNWKQERERDRQTEGQRERER